MFFGGRKETNEATIENKEKRINQILEVPKEGGDNFEKRIKAAESKKNDNAEGNQDAEDESNEASMGQRIIGGMKNFLRHKRNPEKNSEAKEEKEKTAEPVKSDKERFMESIRYDTSKVEDTEENKENREKAKEKEKGETTEEKNDEEEKDK